MDFEKRFLETIPDGFFLSPKKVRQLNSYLSQKGWLRESEVVQSLEKAGEGNMNCVLRVQTNYRTLIIKQSRPWVEKYPQIDAPIGRINVEAEYMRLIDSEASLRHTSPRIMFCDTKNYLIIMEDLGDASDHSSIYNSKEKLHIEDLKSLAEYLSILHSLKAPNFPDNMDMRRLNHEHIFALPFRKDNGLHLDSIQDGLSKLADTMTSNSDLVKKVSMFGQEYLEQGRTLLHGDYYPGSWLKTKTGLNVIDAEFSFKGFAEFDWSVFLAHMYMAQQSEQVIDFLNDRIEGNKRLDLAKVKAFAGIEILRRFYGVAQLPLALSISQKEELASKAVHWILD